MTPKFYEILQKEFRKMTITLSMYNMTTFCMDQNLVLYRKFNLLSSDFIFYTY